ncbi:(d)CMP kinase [Evansella cellulosilytica]|uniref:Cytidylate kinase n=1 Tax=Evansella cellulosilytica (strain ATCC 21833 / DSM 2522 / FERM P-1141 / JCM 9156 / N-4) TaxID=649639 RepID=E6TZD7_EVAC2|nr:(d)CMP kinase [Evansella cellulosilytica]ADU30111.1 cytidylate kinase [Evansella cellulosilytica DSM 2522]
MGKRINIAIDGPAGAGKSTVAKMVAEKLSFIYIDTGAMYRALTYEALKENVEISNGEKLIDLLKKTSIELINKSGKQLIMLNNNDVTEEIRLSEVTNNVSYVARHVEVREEMVRLQQQLAKHGGTVMDGRDIGTAVLPSAEIKVFLTATVDERARRRHEEHLSKGQPSDLELLKSEISQRDKLDSERAVAPLKKADDAIEIDSTFLSIPEVVGKILTIVYEKGDKKSE